jgi:hypothetical protein
MEGKGRMPMSHHSKDPLFTSNLAERLGLGPTGKFPLGKLHRTDEGELKMAVAAEQGKVVLSFGTPVAFRRGETHWVVMEPHEAEGLAEMLIKWAKVAAS